MNKLGSISLVLALGLVAVIAISPLLAQSQRAEPQEMTCVVGEASSAACSGKWIFFAGNSGTLEESVWVVRIDSETGEVWYKNGKKFQLIREVE